MSIGSMLSGAQSTLGDLGTAVQGMTAAGSSDSMVSQMQNIANTQNTNTIATAKMASQQAMVQGLASVMTNGASGIKNAARGGG